MSRIGKIPLEIPAGVTVTCDAAQVEVRGPKGGLTLKLSPGIRVRQEQNLLRVERDGDSKALLAMHGTLRSHLANMLVGVSRGHTRALKIEGLGYRAQCQNGLLTMSLGLSHTIEFKVPEDLDVQVKGTTDIEVSGLDIQRVGQVSARIRSFRPVEPYKGKGLRYADERVRRKAGKTVT